MVAVFIVVYYTGTMATVYVMCMCEFVIAKVVGLYWDTQCAVKLVLH